LPGWLTERGAVPFRGRGQPMTTKPTASNSAGAAAKPGRGVFGQELTAGRPGSPPLGPEAKRAAAVVLEVLAGVRTPTAAAAALGIRLPRYFLLEQRAVQGLVAACAPRCPGRTINPDRRLAQLERELAVSRRELLRQQALARTAQRALGLMPAPAPGPLSRPAGKAQGGSSATKPRRRKPVARGLKAARLLAGAEASGAVAVAVVQPANRSPAVPGSAGALTRPAAMEPPRGEPRAEHGGPSHAGRPKASGN
jgi:hypothetical protein